MSLYSRNIRTRDLDPANNIPNQLVTFRLPEGAYYPNLRLANIGVIQTGNHHYNRIAGVYSVIKHVRLTVNGQELDSLRFANRYLAWSNMNNSNEDNLCINKMLNKNNLGYDVTVTNSNGTAAANGKEFIPVRDQRVAAARDDASLGHLDLRKCLPLLENIPYLDSDLMGGNIQLTVEFESSAVPVTVDNANAVSVQSPVLLVDEIINDETRKALRAQTQGVIFSKIEHDVVQVPEASARPATTEAPIPQSVSLKVNSFDDKFVNRIICMKSYVDKSKYIQGTEVIGLGDFGSLSVFREKWNFRLNGALVFPTGINSRSARAMMLSDAWGKVNYIPYGNMQSVGLDEIEDKVSTITHKDNVPFKLSATEHGMYVGTMDYCGFTLNERVNELNIDFARETVERFGAFTAHGAGDPAFDALEIHVYAECRKSINFSNGQMNIAYI